MTQGNVLEIVARYYDLLLWVIPEIGKIPRAHRFTLGEKIEKMPYRGFDDLIVATAHEPDPPVWEPDFRRKRP